MTYSADVLIVGGGPAGAMAACALRTLERTPLIVERHAHPADSVCGAFLSTETIDMLARIGVDMDAMGARVISRLRMTCGDKEALAALPFEARSLSRLRLDAILRARAAEMGARIETGTSVRRLMPSAGGWAAVLQDGRQCSGPTVLLATGKRDLRGMGRGREGSLDLIGFKQNFRLGRMQARHLRETVEIHLFPGGYAGLQLIEDGLANLCLLVTRQAYAEAGLNWNRFRQWLCAAAPLLAKRLAGASATDILPLAIANMPYGHIHRASGDDDIFRLGDQAAVIPSFTGDGLAIALWSAECAAAHIGAGKTAAAYHRHLAQGLRRQFRVAGLLHRLALNGAGRHGIMAAARHLPFLMTYAARATRLRQAPENQALRVFGTADGGTLAASGARRP